MILTAFLKAIAQLPDPRFRRVLWLGIGLSFGLLIAAGAGLLALIEHTASGPVTLPLIGQVEWLGDLLGWSSLLLLLLASVFLMVPVASAITSMFLDDVADAVEARHYPNLPAAPRVPFTQGLIDTLSFLGVLIVANLLAFILYAFMPPMAPLIFWGLNGFLLGREYFTLAAMRRVGRSGARDMRRRHAGTIWIAGTLMAIPLSVPLLNLLIPILGAATFTHLFNQLWHPTQGDQTSRYRSE